MPGARSTRSLVCKIKKHTSIVTTVTPVSPGIPYAMVLTASFVLSLVSRACCHHRLQDHRLTGLISASGYQDHTTSPSAGFARSSGAIPASTASRPTSVTIAKRPFVGTGWRGSIAVSTRRQNEIFFERTLDATGKSVTRRHWLHLHRHGRA